VIYYKDVTPKTTTKSESVQAIAKQKTEITKQKADISKMKRELKLAKEHTTKKDLEIASLQKELKTIQQSQESINTLLKSDKMSKLLESIK